MGHVKHRYEPYACHMRWISFFSAGTIGTSGAMARMVGQDLHVAAPTIHVVHLPMRVCTAGHQLMVTAGLLGLGMLTKWGGGGGGGGFNFLLVFAKRAKIFPPPPRVYLSVKDCIYSPSFNLGHFILAASI